MHSRLISLLCLALLAGCTASVTPPAEESATGGESVMSEGAESQMSSEDPEAVQREAACPEPAAACPSPQSPVCHDGRWYCRAYPPAQGRVLELNFPSEEEMREGCGEPALACEVPTIPDCRNGTWNCVGPARPA